MISVVMATLLRFSGLKLCVGVPQPKPMHGFSSNFKDMSTPRGSTAD